MRPAESALVTSRVINRASPSFVPDERAIARDEPGAVVMRYSIWPIGASSNRLNHETRVIHLGVGRWALGVRLGVGSCARRRLPSDSSGKLRRGLAEARASVLARVGGGVRVCE